MVNEYPGDVLEIEFVVILNVENHQVALSV